ncbi:MAG: YicC/YloC family endoribonuclease, partial [Pseudomonadota bacterium]
MVVSMTGFAARKGVGAGYAWAWDLRSVNGKGLDLRLRLPDWIDGLEPAVRAALAATVMRGNVSLTLKVARDVAAGDTAGLRLNRPALTAALQALAEVEACAMASGLTLAQPTAADVLALRGILDPGTGDDDTGPLRAALVADLAPLLTDFAAARQAEGA